MTFWLTPRILLRWMQRTITGAVGCETTFMTTLHDRGVKSHICDPTCEYGHPTLCGQPATWVCYPYKFPLPAYACDRHTPLTAEADCAHRLPSAPPLGLSDLKAFVTALAALAVLLRDSDPLRADNARAAFLKAHNEYVQRSTARPPWDDS